MNSPLTENTQLKISISGIRGTIPAGLDPLNLVQFVRAFAAVTGKRIVIGHDSRPTGPAIQHIIVGVLMACGKDVVTIGLAPTPTVKAAVKLWNAHAGIIISASHNPLEWNGLKFVGPEGFFFFARDLENWHKALQSERSPAVEYNKFGSFSERSGTEAHIEDILRIIPNLSQIRSKAYSVVVDAVNGAGRRSMPALLERLGCRVIPLYCDEEGTFPRPPEPTPAALKKFGALVKQKKAAVGFALDPDADRLVVASCERGVLSEEYTLPLSLLGAGYLGKRRKGSIVVNLSTSNLIDQIAAPSGLTVVRSAVGEANVVAKMKALGAIFGGEGNGGVIHPDVASYGRDSLTGAALILSAMAAGNNGLDDLLVRLPDLYMEKDKAPLKNTDPESIFQALKKAWPDAQTNEEDGLRLDFSDGGWLHVRASNTEPVLRFIAQSSGKPALKKILTRARQLVGG
ncbi:MAG: phosphoglucosamine mutase [Spirochaetales bacterium]|nr:phosphoglucosamine mutase [Spirochaetales bacterium]